MDDRRLAHMVTNLYDAHTPASELHHGSGQKQVQRPLLPRLLLDGFAMWCAVEPLRAANSSPCCQPEKRQVI